MNRRPAQLGGCCQRTQRAELLALAKDGGSLRATWSQRHNGNRAIRAPQAAPFGTHAVQGVLRRFTGPYGASGRVGPALLLQNVRGSGGVASVISFGFRPELVSFARRWCLLISWDDH